MAETLSKDEVARLVGVESRTLERMIRDGCFPVGTKATPQSRPVWTVEVVRAWLLIKPLLRVEAGPAPPASDEDS